jgi:hypothetical protein
MDRFRVLRRSHAAGYAGRRAFPSIPNRLHERLR